MYDDLVKRLRDAADEVDNDYDVDPYNAEQRCLAILEAADAIEKLSRKYTEERNAAVELTGELATVAAKLPRWTPVTEELPDAHKEVYVTDGEYIARANLLDEVFPGDRPCWSYSGLGEITDWCERIPLPRPTEEE